ncbi:exodeoxyribonuclease III [candidate division KSB3 bacterium]|uniref:Exodeoxyribonuclease III n=1 Tax=candidate division KSB3 bacterium TaxID=2044937 RepID=A0A2G6KKJ2_9BACT|nr:MAG: exodeoxyribonuclease III [candidate division KSB3 bacterium]
MTRRLISWNVNGIRAWQKKGAVDWFIQEQPDIFCLQETKAHREQLNVSLTDVEGYHAYFASAERKGYSGVAVYTKEQPKSVTAGFGVERFDREGRTLVLEYDAFTLLNVYFPNGQSSEERLQYKMDFYEAFLLYIETVKAQGKNLVICGDVNTAHTEIDLARPKANEKTSGFLPQERAWIDKLCAHGYVDTFRMFTPEPDHYTWWSYRARARERNVGWRIDYFWVNEAFKQQVTAAFILPDVMGSDHCPLGIEVSV